MVRLHHDRAVSRSWPGRPNPAGGATRLLLLAATSFIGANQGRIFHLLWVGTTPTSLALAHRPHLIPLGTEARNLRWLASTPCALSHAHDAKMLASRFFHRLRSLVLSTDSRPRFTLGSFGVNAPSILTLFLTAGATFDSACVDLDVAHFASLSRIQDDLHRALLLHVVPPFREIQPFHIPPFLIGNDSRARSGLGSGPNAAHPVSPSRRRQRPCFYNLHFRATLLRPASPHPDHLQSSPASSQ
ncbi:hypothetical protein C8R45DRAFT_1208939 [Mycena sanguinolenta]|nr:hypothetical protein C8R45DRAFT_1208939 [Mycena sanguinolenta]